VGENGAGEEHPGNHIESAACRHQRQNLRESWNDRLTCPPPATPQRAATAGVLLQVNRETQFTGGLSGGGMLGGNITLVRVDAQRSAGDGDRLGEAVDAT
jgi:hypothetical protein